MRIALLTAQRKNSEGNLIAGTRLAGRSLIEWQVDFAGALGCERVICLADAVGHELLATQHFAESRALEFISAKGPLPLTALVAAGHEILILQEGLWLDPAKLPDALKCQPVVAAISDQEGAYSKPQLERIDRTRLWAGYAIVPSRLVGKLTDYPADSDCISMLLRLSLQARLKTVSLDQDHQVAAQWQFVDVPEAAQELERNLFAEAIPQSDWRSPTEMIAARLASQIVRTGLPVRGGVILGLALLSFLVALALAIWSSSIAALATTLAGSAMVALFTSKRELSVRVLGENVTFLDHKLGLMRDAFLTATLSIVASRNEEGLLPIFVIGLIVLAERLDSSILRPFWADRTLHIGGLTLALLFGQLGVVLSVLGLVALAALLVAQAEER